MAQRLMLVAHAPTAATRLGAFPGDDAVSAEDLPLPVAVRSAQVLVGPERRCRQTAEALGWAVETAYDLADLNAGRWRGRSLDNLLVHEPDALRGWLTEPTARPHGGESLVDLVTRVGRVLDGRDWPDGRSVVVTSPLVVRAAIVHLLQAPASLIFAFDIAPLSATTLSGARGRWKLRSFLPEPNWDGLKRAPGSG